MWIKNGSKLLGGEVPEEGLFCCGQTHFPDKPSLPFPFLETLKVCIHNPSH